jgi:hypothetical protein
VNRESSFFPAGRSRGVTVAVEGFFAFVWFGWGQAAAPSWLVIPLGVGTGLGALLAVAGIALARRSAGRLPVMSDPLVRRRYGIIVGLEFGLLGAGAAVLGATGEYRWVPVWICLGVGVHFFPLAATLENPSLRPLGALLIAVSAAALIAGLVSSVAPSTVTGPGAGLSLLAFGLATLLARRDDGIGTPAGTTASVSPAGRHKEARRDDGSGQIGGTTAWGRSCLFTALSVAADRGRR